MSDDHTADEDRLAVAQKHRAIRQSLMKELGGLSADELQHIRAARYGLKELVDDAGWAHGLYQIWYGAHWPDKGVGPRNDGLGFALLTPSWRQQPPADGRSLKQRYDDRKAYVPTPLKRGRGPMVEAGSDRGATVTDVEDQAKKNAAAYKFTSDDHRDRWIDEQVKTMKEEGIEPPAGWVGTLFLYWAHEATARFYERFLPDRDRHFFAQRERKDADCNTVADPENFSPAARFALKLAQGFAPGYAPKHCHRIVDLWGHKGTNAKKINDRNAYRDRLFLANRLFNPMAGSQDNPEFELGETYQPN